MSETVTVSTDAGDMPAHLWLPPTGHGPGIVLVQEIFGVSAYIERRAAQLAELGYVVLAPEIYWRIGETTPIEGDGALEKAMGLMQRVDWEAAVADGAAAVRALRERDETTGEVGLVGFCFGGGLAFNVAATMPVAALVSYYGSALPGLLELAPRVTIPSLHHFGLADSFIDNENVERIRRAVTAQPGTTFHTYEGADHAFDNEDLPWHHPAASAEAWERTTVFLRTVLPV
ncbi:MAG: dienelactone hydrolase family protein [Terracoccus sp.]